MQNSNYSYISTSKVYEKNLDNETEEKTVDIQFFLLENLLTNKYKIFMHANLVEKNIELNFVGKFPENYYKVILASNNWTFTQFYEEVTKKFEQENIYLFKYDYFLCLSTNICINLGTPYIQPYPIIFTLIEEKISERIKDVTKIELQKSLQKVKQLAKNDEEESKEIKKISKKLFKVTKCKEKKSNENDSKETPSGVFLLAKKRKMTGISEKDEKEKIEEIKEKSEEKEKTEEKEKIEEKSEEVKDTSEITKPTDEEDEISYGESYISSSLSHFSYIFRKEDEIGFLINYLKDNINLTSVHLNLIYNVTEFKNHKKDVKNIFNSHLYNKDKLLILIQTSESERFGIYINNILFSKETKEESCIEDNKSFIFSLKDLKIYKPKIGQKSYYINLIDENFLFKTCDSYLSISNNFLITKEKLGNKCKSYDILYPLEINGGNEEYMIDALEVFKIQEN